MKTAILPEAPDVEVFAARFRVAARPADVTPRGSYEIGNDDTGTWRQDTEDRDT
jgi:hypothetical protein